MAFAKNSAIVVACIAGIAAFICGLAAVMGLAMASAIIAFAWATGIDLNSSAGSVSMTSEELKWILIAVVVCFALRALGDIARGAKS